jgi:predicted nucleic acid-binding Zn ribbon protein
VLTVRADSTAWATQLRLLLPQVQRRLDEEVGEGVVTKVVVLAPTAPSWRRGPRSAPGGVGPRDTYG